ncbi:ADP-ribosyl cyclase/cyclic ADP-ribose hydrolase-like [Antedon mediterranea]|uniref:ADP-ribosyl cyclase/cyclic ADP-ribose hydrolase-like n=1 Tax=Antedon mediterranea TaxID=105859 RepID=UPI003AF7ADE6
MFCLLFVSVFVATSSADPGTTPDIESIFIGRCSEYKHGVYPVNGNWLVDQGFSQSLDCVNLYTQFLSAFENKDPCSIEENAFEQFISNIEQVLPADSPLFWSGTNTLAHRYALASGLKTMEDTLIGYLMNNLMFCGSTSSGLNYAECPGWGSCNDPMSTFWDSASKSFASRANGNIAVLLSGSNADGAYRNYSVFARIEVPNLNPDSISNLRIIVSHDIGKTNPKHETCDDGSLLTLKADLDKRELPYTCEEDTAQLTYVQCSSNVDAKECMYLISGSNQIKVPVMTTLLAFIYLTTQIN